MDGETEGGGGRKKKEAGKYIQPYSKYTMSIGYRYSRAII